MSILAHQVKNPSPEEDIDKLDDEKEEKVGNMHSHSSKLKSVHVAGDVLEGNNNQSNNGNIKVQKCRRAQIFQFTREHILLN